MFRTKIIDNSDGSLWKPTGRPRTKNDDKYDAEKERSRTSRGDRMVRHGRYSTEPTGREVPDGYHSEKVSGGGYVVKKDW